MTDKEKIINLLHQRLQQYREQGGLFSGGVPSTRAVDYYYAECAAIIELVKSLLEENKGMYNNQILKSWITKRNMSRLLKISKK